MTRALATIDTITAVERHPDADRLDIATVRGWNCVVARDEFQAGEPVIFIEPDAFLSETEERWSFLMPRGVKTAPDGQRGHVLRTAKLRGVLSQGLVLKPDAWPEVAGLSGDVTDALPLRLWEPMVPVTSDIIGPFPSGISKTDEERIQNIAEERWRGFFEAHSVQVTVKLDGSSCTAFLTEDDIGVAGRNWELSPACSTYKMVAESDSVAFLTNDIYVQGELVGPGVQGNRLKLPKPQFRPFTVGEMGTNGRLHPDWWPATARAQMVPVLPEMVDVLRGTTIPEAIAAIDGLRAAPNTQVLSEGVVIRSYDYTGRVIDSVKIINNAYLLKER
jgi:RNA ligase (TIGR02306 family)